MEADLQSHYGIDARDILTNGIGARRLRALVQGLPVGSALHRSIDPEGWAWRSETELLADAVELLDANLKLHLRVNTKPGTHVPDVVHIPRPNRPKPQAKPRPQSSAADIKKYMGKKVKVTT